MQLPAFEPSRPGVLGARSQKLSKAHWEELRLGLEGRLLRLQFALREADFPLIVVLSGEDRPGAGELLARLGGWLDPRHLRVHALGAPTDEERERPALWRFWRELPGRGQWAVFVGAWTAQAIVERRSKGKQPSFERDLAHIERTERAWVEDGALLLKFWLHLPKSKLKQRLDEAHELRFARFDELDWALATDPTRTRARARRALLSTGTEVAPWHLVPGRHRRQRDALILTRIAEALERRLAGDAAPAPVGGADRGPGVAPADRPEGERDAPAPDAPRRREGLAPAVPDEGGYERRLGALQARLAELTREAMGEGLSAAVVFEGWDAAGKGGAIRRVTASLDPLCYRVTQIAKPTEEEHRRHYLWRFWTRLPRPGRLEILDRSWYGRVLVERVEGFAAQSAWQRAYGEINDFESQLTDAGLLVQKFWLEISPQTQLERFQAREKDPLKRYKITEEDYRNRSRWPAYEAAADEMLARTHRPNAPWTVVAADRKEAARLAVLETLVARYERALGRG